MDRQCARNSVERANNADGRLSPKWIAFVSCSFLFFHIKFDDNQQAYQYLVNQARSAWTWDLDREPAW
jgi:hypothetical protein